jgi:hypothetical protein
MQNQNKALYGLIAMTLLAVGFSLSLADVIFSYNGYVNVNVIEAPLTFSLGPNNAASGYVSTAVSPTGFTINVAVTNAADIYYYEPLVLTASTSGYLYVNQVSVSGNNLIQNMYAVVNTGTQVYWIPLVENGQAVQYSSSETSYSLNKGSYYVSLWIEPTTPQSSTSVSESITASFGYNVVASSPIQAPTSP